MTEGIAKQFLLKAGECVLYALARLSRDYTAVSFGAKQKTA